MCSEPVMRAPFKGCWVANSWRMAIRPGISVSAILISLRPQAARPMSAMTQSVWMVVGIRAFMECAPWVVVEPLTVR